MPITCCEQHVSWQCCRPQFPAGVFLAGQAPSPLDRSGAGRRDKARPDVVRRSPVAGQAMGVPPVSNPLLSTASLHIGPGVNSSIDVGCCAMIQLLSRTPPRGSRSKKCRAVRPVRASLVARVVLRLVRCLGVGVPGVVLELVGCITRSARVKLGGSRDVVVHDIRALWAELTP